MRAFLAIELDEKTKDTICAMITRLSSAADGISWARREHLHLTLWFFEELPEASLEGVADLINSACSSTSPFELEVTGTGFFGPRDRPRVLWCGLAGETGKLKEFQKKVGQGLTGMGFKEDKPFNPHLTLGRNRGGSRQEKAVSLLRGMNDYSVGRFRVTGATLFASELRPGGAVHTPLRSFRLGAVS